MRALLDLNVLLALSDSEHVCHGPAKEWMAANHHLGWATCPLTENGFVRVSSQKGYAEIPMPPQTALRLLRTICESPDHAFWPDDLSLRDGGLFDGGRILGPKQITDIYLLALAVKNEGRLVTFDRAITPAAVKGALEENLVVL